MKEKEDPKLPQEVEVKVDIVTSDIKICYTGKLQDFTGRYIIKILTYKPNCSIVNDHVSNLKAIRYKSTALSFLNM